MHRTITLPVFLLFIYLNIFADSGKQHKFFYLTNYSFKEYDAHSQNWSIIQDKRGILYFANTQCILEYDGITWNKIYAPNKSIIRSFAMDTSGTIYVGAVGEIGYLTPAQNGKLVFKSLTDLLDSTEMHFNDVWETVLSNNQILFRAGRQLMRYNPSAHEMKTWKAEGVYYPSFHMPGENYGFIIREDNRFFLLKNEQLIPLNESKNLSNIFAYKILPVWNDRFLCISDYQLYTFDLLATKDPLSPFYTDFDEAFRQAGLYMGTILDKNTFAVTSRNDGVFILNNRGKAITHINEKQNLQDNLVWNIYQSKDSILWLSMNNGIAKVEYKSPFRIWNKSRGFDKSINKLIVFEDILYIGTMNGVYQLDLENSTTITKGNGPTIGIWDFAIIHGEKTSEKHMLIAGTNGLYQLKENNIERISDQNYLFGLEQSKYFKNRVYLAESNGLIAIEFQDNAIKKLGHLNLSGECRYLAESKKGDLWLGTTYNGVYHIQFSKNNAKNTSFEKDIFNDALVEKFDTSAGLPGKLGIRPYAINNEILFTTNNGVYYFDEETRTFRKKESIHAALNLDSFQVEHISTDTDSNLLLVSGKEIYHLKKNDNGAYTNISKPLRRIPDDGEYTVYTDKRGTIWIGGASSLVSFMPDKSKSHLVSFKTLIRRVQIGKDSVIFHGAFYEQHNHQKPVLTIHQPNDQIPEIKFKNNSILFNYAAPYFIEENRTQYSYMLDGYESEWSDWSLDTKKEYTNLSEGTYIFRVKAKNVFNTISHETTYQFTILPPWYRTVYAYVAYLFVIILLFTVSIQLYTRRLKQANIQLEKLVEERTAEISMQKEEIVAQADSIVHQAHLLEQSNIELEKLSIVARETDNAITIMDEKGNFEWVNHGFTKLYEFSLEEFIASRGKNIYDCTKDEKIIQSLNHCFKEKVGINYEFEFNTKSGKLVYVQTNITPILDEEGKIKKLISIDTDISKLKKAEKEIIKQRDEISRQKQEITDSIVYAKRIQSAVLPPDKLMSKLLADHFVFYKPRDIVSGDFYWIKQIDDLTILALADCTGHGVPGAFMSMLGVAILNEIVRKKEITRTDQAMNLMREELKLALRQSGKENEADDGINMALLAIDHKKKKIQFAGAYISLFLARDGNLIEIKADKMPIGISYSEKQSFTNYDLTVKKDDVFYLFTDGFVDQFGGKENKRFSTQKFKTLLKEIKHKNMNEQKAHLEKVLSNWMGKEKQVDDITVLGFRMGLQ